MSRTSSASMFGGAGGRDSRASVSTLRGLRSALRPDSRRDGDNYASTPADDKQTMKGLNNRLSGYLGRVRQLEKSNNDLEDKIRDILKKRGKTTDHDWEEIERPLVDLKKQVRQKTLENARLILQIDNSKLANEDFKNKMETELLVRQNVERDLSDLRKVIDDTQLSKMQLESQIEAVKEELAYLKKDHRDDAMALRQKVKESDVTVEMDSPDSTLADTLNKIRGQYESVAVKNRDETDSWYNKKFDNIKVEVAKNTESLQSSKNELNDLRRQKQLLEIDVQSMNNMHISLEETMQDTEGRYGRELARLNRLLQQLESDLGQVRDQVERQSEDYQALLNVKMKLEAEIESYRCLLHGIDDEAPKERVS
ncbi:keratin, type I cytoskeletal 18-like isoform X2 [Clupea harengus]|uniref:Keratin, type I cytoskeletal 18-like isoform X2 n=1 Tax=Clupea harengus TaxID=7950 RepID=A0A6P8EQF4_CLUHA|nr:keratin, type I cytoskeletal 18-like isoform X2 [Clupea harengus]